MESILTSIKKLLGVDENYDIFDPDIIFHINSTLMILAQMGVGQKGFMIEGEDSEWSDFLNDSTDIESVKTYAYLKVKLIFDPPQSSAVIESMKQLINELEWRLNVAVDPIDTF